MLANAVMREEVLLVLIIIWKNCLFMNADGLYLIGILLLLLAGLSGSTRISGKKYAWSMPYEKIVSRE
jgi:hypothetical protein